MARTKVYRNLHKLPACEYSIATNGKVIGHAKQVYMAGGVTMKHATAEQMWRCTYGGKRGTGCREVCQWLLAPVVAFEANAPSDLHSEPLEWRRLGCCPKIGGFADADTGERVDYCDEVYLTESGVWYR